MGPPGSIQPYSGSGALGVAPSSTIRPASRATAAAASATQPIKSASSRMKWSEGNTATVASGSRMEIHWTGKRMPAAVPRSSGWARIESPEARGSSEPT